MVRSLFIAFLFLASFPAYAIEINDEGAQHLKTMFETLIKQHQESYVGDYETKPIFEGPVNVEQAENYYAITLPFYKVEFPDGRRMDFGMVSLNASPDEQSPKRWKMTLAVPTPLTMYDQSNTPIMQIAIGAQRAAGIWNEDFENFTKLDALYSDIKMTSLTDDRFELIIPKSLLRYDIKNEDSLASGDGFILTENILVNIGKENLKGTIGSFRANFLIDQYNMTEFGRAQDRIATLIQGISTEGLDTKARDKELNKAIDSMYSNLGEKMSVEYTVTDLVMSKMEHGGEKNFKIDKAKFGIDLGGFVSGNAYLGTTLGVNNLLLDSDDLNQNILPKNLNIDIRIQNIPVKELTTIAQNYMTNSAQNPNMNGMAMMGLMIKLPTLLSKAETMIKLTDNEIGNESYNVKIDGQVIADVAAMNNFIANINGQFDGLDWLINEIQTLQNTDSTDTAQYSDLLNQLKIIRSFGKKDETTDTDSYSYEFVITPEGTTTMNGEDMGGLIGGGLPLPQ